MHGELKNIYRSWLVVKLISNKENLKMLLSAAPPGTKLESFFDAFIEEAKESIRKSSGANVEHFLSIVYFFMSHNHKSVVQLLIRHSVVKMCGDIIENRLVQRFLSTVLFPAECDKELEAEIAKDVISSGLFHTLVGVIVCVRKSLGEEDPASTPIIPKMMDTSSASQIDLSAMAETACTESYALAAFETLFWSLVTLTDSKCAALEGSPAYKHNCDSSTLLLDYMFDEDTDVFNCFFEVFVEKLTDENFFNLAHHCGLAVNYVLSFAYADFIIAPRIDDGRCRSTRAVSTLW